MPSGAKKRKAAKKKKKESSLGKSSLDTHVDDASATSFPSPGSADKESSDSSSDIASPRSPKAPEFGASEFQEEGKEALSSGGSTAAVMDTSEDGAKATEAEEESVAAVQAEEVCGPAAEEPQVVEADLTPCESAIQVPVIHDGEVTVEHAEVPNIEVPVTHDGGMTINHAQVPDEEDTRRTDDAALSQAEPQGVTDISKEVPLDEKVGTTPETAETSREVPLTASEPAEASREVPLTAPEPVEAPREVQLDEQSGAELAEPDVPVSEEPGASESGYVPVENVGPLRYVEPTSEVKTANELITSAAHLEQPQTSTETLPHTQESQGIGAQAVLPPQSAGRTSWLNCCGLFDVFGGHR